MLLSRQPASLNVSCTWQAAIASAWRRQHLFGSHMQIILLALPQLSEWPPASSVSVYLFRGTPIKLSRE